MKLIQIFLPIADNQGKRFSKDLFDQIKNQLAKKYKGVTAYAQSPAEDLWEQDDTLQSDQIIIYEVMAPDLDKHWWVSFKTNLEKVFKQDEILIRSLDTQML